MSTTSVRVTWRPPPDDDGATVTGYVVHYIRDDNMARMVSGLSPSTTTRDITSLSTGRTYTISVEATTAATDALCGVSEERTITLSEYTY